MPSDSLQSFLALSGAVFSVSISHSYLAGRLKQKKEKKQDRPCPWILFGPFLPLSLVIFPCLSPGQSSAVIFILSFKLIPYCLPWNHSAVIPNYLSQAPFHSVSLKWISCYFSSTSLCSSYFSCLGSLLLLLLLSPFSYVQLCVTPYTSAHQAPPSLGFSRQEHWSGLPFPSPMPENEKWKWSHLVVSDS